MPRTRAKTIYLLGNRNVKADTTMIPTSTTGCRMLLADPPPNAANPWIVSICHFFCRWPKRSLRDTAGQRVREAHGTSAAGYC